MEKKSPEKIVDGNVVIKLKIGVNKQVNKQS